MFPAFNKSRLSRRANLKSMLFLPTIIILLVTIAYPFLCNIYYSFTNYTLVKPVKTFIMFNNYIEICKSDYFIETIIRTIVWTCSNITFMLILGLSTALLLNTNIKGTTIIKGSILIPWVLPEIVTGYCWKWMLSSDYGIINNILEKLNLISADFSWFRSGATAMGVAVLANVWRAFPFMALMFYAKLKTLSREQLEAAKIDGAGTIQTFVHITLPYLKNSIQTVCLLAFIWTFNSFGIIFSLTGGGPINKTETFPFIVQKTAFQYYEFGEASTMSIIMFLIMTLVLLSIYLIPKTISRIIKSN
ncbi:sugar ABC transporter permease [Vallitalea sediminicola]